MSLSGPTSRMNSSDLEDRIEAVCNTAVGIYLGIFRDIYVCLPGAAEWKR
ncbi:MAG: hypothetical protein ACLTBV_30590 [Enterocloster bolteae]